MEIQQLRGFYYSAKLGSLTNAADKMSLTQSAISQQIKSLEMELGIKLFNRYGPRKDITPDGEILLNLITPLIQEIEMLKVTFEDLKGNQKGQLTIAATTVLIMNYLPYIIQKYIKNHPNVRLIILEHRWNEVVSLAESGEVDFGIAPIQSIPSNLSYIELEPFDRILITSLNHPLSRKKDITLQDIAQYPIITYEKGLVHRSDLDHIFKEAKLEIEIVMEATNAETIKRYVEIGIGVAVIPKIALLPTKMLRLHAISVNEFFGKSCYGVIIRKGKYMTSYAKDFLDLLSPKVKDIL
ncbi:LysR family transcriptional regulator [bacterium]|nr:LysR family transcriptional regulator [bacterium]